MYYFLVFCFCLFVIVVVRMNYFLNLILDFAQTGFRISVREMKLFV